VLLDQLVDRVEAPPASRLPPASGELVGVARAVPRELLPSRRERLLVRGDLVLDLSNYD
jgi:hypothetical protein